MRDRTKVRPLANLLVFEGTPTDWNILKQSAQDSEMAISVLNISRISDLSWAKLRTPLTFWSDVMRNIVELSEEFGINRINTCSAWGFNETFRGLPFWFRWMIRFSNIGVAYNDHGRQENILKDSDFDWTIVRPVGLTNSEKE